MFVFSQLESGNAAGAAAVSVVLLAITFGILLSIGGLRRLVTRHERG